MRIRLMVPVLPCKSLGNECHFLLAAVTGTHFLVVVLKESQIHDFSRVLRMMCEPTRAKVLFALGIPPRKSGVPSLLLVVQIVRDFNLFFRLAHNTAHVHPSCATKINHHSNLAFSPCWWVILVHLVYHHVQLFLFSSREHGICHMHRSSDRVLVTSLERALTSNLRIRKI